MAMILALSTKLEETQWTYKPDFSKLEGLPITTRDDVRAMKMDEGVAWCSTSGSTGEQLRIRKTIADNVWYHAVHTRERLWRKWDCSKKIVVIKPDGGNRSRPSWGLPKFKYPDQGPAFILQYKKMSELQREIELINPHYIHATPSIIAQLDLTKISNYIDHKGTGELGGSMYSSEECGVIAIECPDNPEVYHVMENHLVEVDEDGAIIITTLTNPYIKRYKHGDHVELGECPCGRTLQTITKIHGRVRNMFKLEGDSKWPTIGGREYYTRFGIKRFQVIQTALDTVVVKIIREPFTGKELSEFQAFVNSAIDAGIELNVIVEYVDDADFDGYKFEEFICKI